MEGRGGGCGAAIALASGDRRWKPRGQVRRGRPPLWRRLPMDGPSNGLARHRRDGGGAASASLRQLLTGETVETRRRSGPGRAACWASSAPRSFERLLDRVLHLIVIVQDQPGGTVQSGDRGGRRARRRRRRWPARAPAPRALAASMPLRWQTPPTWPRSQSMARRPPRRSFHLRAAGQARNDRRVARLRCDPLDRRQV